MELYEKTKKSKKLTGITTNMKRAFDYLLVTAMLVGGLTLSPVGALEVLAFDDPNTGTIPTIDSGERLGETLQQP